MTPSYPPSLAAAGTTASAPRRVRGFADERLVFDTTAALYVWEWPPYPQYYLPRGDVDMTALVPSGDARDTPQGRVRPHDLRTRAGPRAEAALLVVASPIAGLAGTVRFAWDAVDRWFEEEEEIFVHPRNPYARVDALRSRRTVRIELAGVVLAESDAVVMVFETGLPTRYYVDPSAVRFEHLVPAETRTSCPYKGRTTKYWSAVAGDARADDVAWCYDFPLRDVAPIAGLIAFLNEKVDVFLDGVARPRASTHMD